MVKQKFLICKHCGNIVAYVKESGVPIVCCGEEMVELIPGTTDASKEKHVPVISIDGNIVTVTVGSVAHPMLPEHYILFVELLVGDKVLRHDFKEGDTVAEAVFMVEDPNAPMTAREYCNLHGLWATK